MSSLPLLYAPRVPRTNDPQTFTTYCVYMTWGMKARRRKRCDCEPPFHLCLGWWSRLAVVEHLTSQIWLLCMCLYGIWDVPNNLFHVKWKFWEFRALCYIIIKYIQAYIYIYSFHCGVPSDIEWVFMLTFSVVEGRYAEWVMCRRRRHVVYLLSRLHIIYVCIRYNFRLNIEVRNTVKRNH